MVDGGKLVAGSVANGSHDPDRRGDVEVVSYDLAGGAPIRSTLHKNLQADDHAAPGLLLRPDGRWLAVYPNTAPKTGSTTVSPSARTMRRSGRRRRYSSPAHPRA